MSSRRAGGEGASTTGLRALSPAQTAVIVVAIGLLITVALAWIASTLNSRNEHKLLEVQTQQAGEVVASTILSIEDPLQTALQIATATGASPAEFRRYMTEYTGPGHIFVSTSLWRATSATLRPIATLGVAPDLAPASSATRAFIERARHSATFVVTSVTEHGRQRIGYAIAEPSRATLVVSAERAIPPDRRVPVESNSAFSDLDYATYLGSPARPSDLATTDVPMSLLPLRGDTARDVIPFGDTTLTLLASPRRQLGGALGGELPWIFLVGGVLLTAAAGAASVQLVARRRDAEQGAETIATLYRQLGSLYGEQHTIAETLQRALLPRSDPKIAGMEIASRYVAGAAGVDIGGDWYSMMTLDPGHFAFVVGDVSGRGVRAATIMAQLRFTIRAYLIEGHSPDRVLEMCSRQVDVVGDEHFATVLVGVGNRETGEVVLSSAGHLSPLLVSASSSAYAATMPGLPLGIAPTTYTATSVTVPRGSTLVAFTDGLVERRGEAIDVGLDRLARAAMTPAATLDDLLTILVQQLAHEGADDIAVLAFRFL